MAFDLKNSKALFSRNNPAQPAPIQRPKEMAPVPIAKAAPKPEHPETHEDHEYEESATNDNMGEILHQWSAPEFEVYEKNAHWYLIAGFLLSAVIAYAVFTNSPIMAITFILIGIVGYIYLQKDPRIITFYITSKGVIADRELYLYENIFSFWIFYEPNHTKVISLHTKASMLPFVHIPLGDEDPVKLRELLMLDIHEIKQDPSLIDALERFLHI